MTKATGIVRHIDDLGRVVIPMELRRTLDIKEGDPIEVYVMGGESIVLRKYTPGCLTCGNINNLSTFKDKLFCSDCLEAMPKPR